MVGPSGSYKQLFITSGSYKQLFIKAVDLVTAVRAVPEQKLLPAVLQLGVPACLPGTRRASPSIPRVPLYLTGRPATEHLPTVQHIACHREEIQSRFGHSPHLSQAVCEA